MNGTRSTVDLVEMVLAKSEPVIAKHYDTVLMKDRKAQQLGEEIQSIRQITEEMVLNLSNYETLGENNKLLGRALNKPLHLCIEHYAGGNSQTSSPCRSEWNGKKPSIERCATDYHYWHHE